MKKNIKISMFLSILMIILYSCMDDEEWYTLNSTLDISHKQLNRGLFVVNEGNFMYDNASLTYYDIDSMKVLNNVFYRTNQVPLGDVAQSMEIRDSLGYIVINNSGKIYIIDIHSFEYKSKITGFTSPRYIHFINDIKAYVTDIYAKSISVINPKTNSISGHIDVNNHQTGFYQHPTEQMVQVGKFVYTNCWSNDNKILVIDSETDMVVDSIEVLLQPHSMVLDKAGNLWILSDGGFEGSAYGFDFPGLTCIHTSTNTIAKTILFEKEGSPSEICINKTRDTIFYINKHIYRFAVSTDDAPVVFIESSYSQTSSGGYYGLAVDPLTSEVYVANAVDMVQQGFVYRYSPDGTPVDTFQAGIVPGAFCFKQ